MNFQGGTLYPLDTGLRAGCAGDLPRYPRFRALWRGSRCFSEK